MSEFKSLSGMAVDRTRDDLVFMAHTAEVCGRYEEMCKFMRELIELITPTKSKLTNDERDLLTVAYKNVIHSRRVSKVALNGATDEDQVALIDVYKNQIHDEISIFCREVLTLLEVLISIHTDLDETRVVYFKMKGDYYRYLAESKPSADTEQKAESAYLTAYNLALSISNPLSNVRLGVALNYSVYFYDILNDREKAIELSTAAHNMAIETIAIGTKTHKDSCLILQLLKDNITLWTDELHVKNQVN
jgi:hypothetical protein